MKYIRVELQCPPELMHPIHRLIDDSEAILRDVLVEGNVLNKEVNTFLFYVEGDPNVYVEALQAVDQIREFEITRIDETGFYAFLIENQTEDDEEIFSTFQRAGVVLAPPIDFRPNGVVRLTVIGEGQKLKKVLVGLPDDITATILQVGEYNWRQSLFDPGITDRQFEALSAAVECGYYDTPQSGTLNDVAQRIGISSSTASEHLRKAESAVMSAFIDLRNVV